MHILQVVTLTIPTLPQVYHLTPPPDPHLQAGGAYLALYLWGFIPTISTLPHTLLPHTSPWSTLAGGRRLPGAVPLGLHAGPLPLLHDHLPDRHRAALQQVRDAARGRDGPVHEPPPSPSLPSPPIVIAPLFSMSRRCQRYAPSTLRPIWAPPPSSPPPSPAYGRPLPPSSLPLSPFHVECGPYTV